MSEYVIAAPKEWRGRFFEDMEVGDVFRSRFGRTVSETDNLLFTCLTMNTNPLHFDESYVQRTRWKRILVNSTLTLALVTGMSVPDTSENAAANLSWSDIKLPNPVFIGDTIWVETEILDARESASNPTVGIIRMRTRGINQDGVVVCEFRRAVMLYRRDSQESESAFPKTDTDWTV